jgi:hypothetical protein
MANGFPVFTQATRALIEQCLIDQFFDDEVACGNNPFAGLLRLGFHDCATSDPDNTTFPGGCNAWASIHCSQFEQCEFQSFDNIGLKPWILALDNMYDTAQLNGQPLNQLLSRADFWHLASNRGVVVSSNGAVDPAYFAGRFDPQQLFANPQSFGPRFVRRLPEFFAFSEMERVCGRNNLDNFHAAALLGGHTLGHAHPEVSGFRGSWDPTPTVFDADYWEVLQDQDWFTTTITAVNIETGQTTTATQYALGGVNQDRSIQLFADVNQLVSTTFDSQCSHVKIFQPNALCTPNNPPIFGSAPSILTAWAQSPSTFFSAFSSAWESVQQWGCRTGQCPRVGNTPARVNCGTNTFRHSCSKHFQETPAWVGVTV